VEKLRDDYARAASVDEQKEIAEEIQRIAYDEVMYVPLGQYFVKTAWRNELDGVLDGPAPFFWNIAKE